MRARRAAHKRGCDDTPLRRSAGVGCLDVQALACAGAHGGGSSGGWGWACVHL